MNFVIWRMLAKHRCDICVRGYSASSVNTTRVRGMAHGTACALRSLLTVDPSPARSGWSRNVTSSAEWSARPDQSWSLEVADIISMYRNIDSFVTLHRYYVSIVGQSLRKEWSKIDDISKYRYISLLILRYIDTLRLAGHL